MFLTEKILHPLRLRRGKEGLGPSSAPAARDLGSLTQWHLGQQQPRKLSWARRAIAGSGEMDRSEQGG